MVRRQGKNPSGCTRVFAMFSALIPAIAHAEIMDKELSLMTLLGTAIVGALAAFLMARRKPWLLFVFLPVMALFFTAHVSEIMDPFVGPAMAAEAGGFYIFVSWAAPLLVLLGLIIGLALRYHNAKEHAKLS